MKKIALLYTTISSEHEAKKLVNLVLSEKLATCVNVITSGISIYLWNEKIEENNECYLLFKTTENLMDDLEKLILQNHPYELPAILKFEASSSKDFFNYISRTQINENIPNGM